MKNNETATTTKGIGFCGLLTIVFITLKLCNVIQWSWLWVLSPIWIPGALFIVGGLIFLAVCFLLDKRDEKKQEKVREKHDNKDGNGSSV